MKHFEEILCSIGAVNCIALQENQHWTLWRAEYRTPVSVVRGYYLYLKSKCPLLEANATNFSIFRAKCGSEPYDVVVTPKSDLAKDLTNTVTKFKGKAGYTSQTLLDEYLTGKITYKSLLREEYFVAPSLITNEQATSQDALKFLTDWLTGKVSTSKNSPIGIICADGGIGKTTLARELCESVRLRDSKVLPLLIEADQWKNIANTGFTLDTLWDIAIARRLENANSLRANPSALRVLMQEGLLVVIFDGFDELAAMSNDKNRPQEILAELKERFTPEDEETGARVILTSRYTYWTAIKSSISNLESIEEFRLNGFDNAQRKEYFQKRLANPEHRDLALRLAKEISGAMYSHEAAVTIEARNEDRISGTPFILSLIAYGVEGNEKISVEPYEVDPLEPIMLGVCRRENIRQDLKIAPEKQLSIFEEIFRSYDESIGADDLDLMLQVYEISDQNVRDRFSNHFLLQRISANVFKARFEVLKVYFIARFLAKGLQRLYAASHAKEIALTLSKNAIGQSQVNEWLAWQLSKLSREKLRAAIRHAFEIIALPENNLNRHRASIALSHLISQLLRQESKVDRTVEMFDLLGMSSVDSNKNPRNLIFSGKLKSFDFSGLSFENCTFVDVNFANCKFDERTHFNSSKFEGSLDFTNCDGTALANFDTTQRSDEAELTISGIKKQTPSTIVRQAFADEALTRALRKFRGDTGLHSIQVRRSQNGANPRNPYNSEIWKALKRQGVVGEHEISGVSEGGYHIIDDRDIRREVIQYLDNGIIGSRLKTVLVELIG